jgi:ComF family protein
MSLLRRLLDVIYPPRCLICREFLPTDSGDESGAPRFLCHPCLSRFRPIVPPLCPVCGRPFPAPGGEDHLCEACLKHPPAYEATRAPYRFEGPLMEAIHRFKYGGNPSIAHSLGPLLAGFARTWLAEDEDRVIMPVPLHPKRLRERGFNQSLLLARHVARELETEVDFLSLRRVRYTPPQTTLPKEARRKNVRGAFQLHNPGPYKGKSVLLVDDVATTGNTLNECARALTRSGCRKVRCLVLARTMGQDRHGHPPSKDQGPGRD